MHVIKIGHEQSLQHKVCQAKPDLVILHAPADSRKRRLEVLGESIIRMAVRILTLLQHDLRFHILGQGADTDGQGRDEEGVKAKEEVRIDGLLTVQLEDACDPAADQPAGGGRTLRQTIQVIGAVLRVESGCLHNQRIGDGVTHGHADLVEEHTRRHNVFALVGGEDHQPVQQATVCF